jgi:diguanylate cyclase (GGDEF)-like protein
MRYELVGALTTWAATGTAFAARNIWAPTHYDIPHFSAESVTFPLGVLLLVALTTGHLARAAARTSEEHRRARAESERRAELLALVAGASRKLAALEVDRLLSGVVDAAAAFGFDGVELCMYDGVASTWSVAHAKGLPEHDGRTPLDPDLPGGVRARQATVLVQHGDDDAGPAAGWRAQGYRSVVALPIPAGDSVVAALIVGTTEDRAVGAPEVESLELLATQAGVGLANVRLLDRIRHQALHDALTGLPNQLLFEDRVAQALTQARRTDTTAALMFVDLDRFKKINDTLGHDFGNELLRQVAGRLLGAVRAGDTVARMGGDEFTLLLPALTNERDTEHVAGKVVDALRAPFAVGDHQLFVTASVGIAVYPSDGARYETLLKHADIAMYRAKAAGGNTFELYGSRTADAVTYPRLALEADLHMALPRRELRVVYQPELDLTEGGGVVAMEALIRWRHPQYGDIEPAEFLPLAEEAGLLGAIDMWVLQSACTRAAQWRREGAADVRVAVNVSPRQLQQPRFADNVLASLERSGLPGNMLELEVTEGTAVTEVMGVRDALSRLRAAGVRIAIDDFGTGYSMLSRLRDFPLDTLKIDRSFIAEIHERSDEAPIVSATIAMARSLGLDVVAEGVEEEAQLAFVRDAGCDLAQGFLLSRPVEADAVIDLLVEDKGGRAVVLS